jgi:CheY-like chemotaxis protein
MLELPRILHVEDDEDIREIVMFALESIGGMDVKQSASGRDALVLAPQMQPDIFLLDYMMPGMNGEETLQALRDMPLFAETPAIFMTAKAQHAEVGKLMRLGAIGVIVKPFNPMTLCEDILSLWSQRPRQSRVA